MHQIVLNAIEREYGIPYKDWPIASETTNYLDAVFMLDLRSISISNQIGLIYEYLYDDDIGIYELRDIIDTCRYIIKKNYVVGKYRFDPDLIGIILRRAVLADDAGLVLLPNYRGCGYEHINCWTRSSKYKRHGFSR